MKKFIVFFLFIFSCSFCNAQINKRIPLNYPNSCLINSIVAYEAINKKLGQHNIWSEVLGVVYYENRNGKRTKEGHAVCVYEWRGNFYLYDINNGGSIVEMNGISSDIKKDAVAMAEWIFGQGNIEAAEYLAK
jgi:hypothetical protein